MMGRRCNEWGFVLSGFSRSPTLHRTARASSGELVKPGTDAGEFGVVGSLVQTIATGLG